MRTFIYSFFGYYPVGACAVVCAEDRENADKLFAKGLKDYSNDLWLKNSCIDPMEPSGYERIIDFESVDVIVMPTDEHCNIVLDGDY